MFQFTEYKSYFVDLLNTNLNLGILNYVFICLMKFNKSFKLISLNLRVWLGCPIIYGDVWKIIAIFVSWERML